MKNEAEIFGIVFSSWRPPMVEVEKKIWSVSRGTICWFDMEWPLHKNSLIKLYNLRKRKIHTAPLTLFTCAFWHMRVENLLEEPAKLRKITLERFSWYENNLYPLFKKNLPILPILPFLLEKSESPFLCNLEISNPSPLYKGRGSLHWVLTNLLWASKEIK